MNIRERLIQGGAILALLLAWAAPALPAPSGAPAKEDKSKVVVAEINGHKITLADLEERLEQAPPAVRIQIRKNKEQYLDGLVQSELLYQEAVQRKLESTPGVAKRIGLAKRRILVEEFVKREVQRAVQVSDSDLRAFFDANRDRFRRKEQVTLSHVVLKTEKEAWDAVAEVRRGVPFAQVARARSIFEATRDAGGVMGTAARGELDKKIEEAAFKLAIGQVSEPIQTSLGWQIIRVSERIAGADAKFEDVKEDVKQILIDVRHRASYQRMIEELKKKGSVSVHPERFK